MMKCPICGSADLVHQTRDVPFIYKGHKFVIGDVTGDFCPACGESILDSTESEAFMTKTMQCRKRVNNEIIAPEFIVQIRKKLGLNQKEASEIFGGGVNAFSRYEKGQAQPHPSTIKLLQVLDRHPDLLSEIR
ncbi:type II toxin-antitoxin system MqsA family antitoxin [Sodalis sp. RH15]|uniref:type II toxin-antitoxin system MqsA family antitoxin n=1 Tax=Sodalis sp. RH15 TaxID=3394330 RepID=UPI0039B5AA7C